MSIDAIIPAHNEASTVRAVASVVMLSGFRSVVVVDDGSTDDTAGEAARTGARVLRLSPNRGKAEAMLAGLAGSDADAVAFFDADLLGLTVGHVELMKRHFEAGFDQVCGLQDYGLWNPLQLVSPLITGQRIVRRWVLDSVPASCWRGYAIETALNFIVDTGGGSTCLVPLRGLTFRNKTSKVGLLRGWLQHLGMARQIRAARGTLEDTDGRACAVDRG